MIELLEVDLGAADASPRIAPSTVPVWIVVRDGAAVLGELRLRSLDASTAVRLPQELRARFEPVRALRRSIAAAPHASTESPPSMSVVVDVNDAADADACLDHIERATQAANVDVEVVVVDRTADHGLGPLCRARGATHRVIGDDDWAASRDDAWRSVDGEVIVFVDGHCLVDRHFFASLQRTLRHPEIDAVVALELPAELDTYSQIAYSRRASGIRDRFSPRVLGHDVVASVPSLRAHARSLTAVRRKALAEAGGFDVSLDRPSASALATTMALLARLIDGGYVAVYESSVVIRRRPPVTRGELLGHARELGHASRAILDARSDGASRRAKRRLAASYAVRVARAIRRRKLLDVQLVLAEAAGALGAKGRRDVQRSCR